MLLEELTQMLLVVAGNAVFVPDLLVSNGCCGEAVDRPGKNGRDHIMHPVLGWWVVLYIGTSNIVYVEETQEMNEDGSENQC